MTTTTISFTPSDQVESQNYPENEKNCDCPRQQFNLQLSDQVYNWRKTEETVLPQQFIPFIQPIDTSYDEDLNRITQAIRKNGGTWTAGLNPVFLKTDEEKKLLLGLTDIS